MLKPSLLISAALFVATQLSLGQSVSVTYSYGGLPVPILTDSADTVSLLNVFVPRALTVQSVQVTVDIDYPRPGDLNVFFYSPIATRTKLLERNCGATGTLSNIIFTDSASQRYMDACPSASGGSFRSNEPLANSVGQNAFGYWTLAVENNGSNDFLGRVVGVSVTITGTPVTNVPVSNPAGIVSSSSRQADGIAPGELIDIFGVGLGPVPGVRAPTGNLPTSLGGTSVTIGGKAAAVDYASGGALRVQAPYDLTLESANVVITYNGISSTSIPVTIIGAKPGIFATNPNGTGVAKANNQDGTVNSTTSRAPANSIVAFYLTGLGAISPALTTGQTPPSSPLSTTTSMVTATIDGVAAPVLFSGAAPGLPGFYQVNVQVPAVSSGAKSVVIYANGVPSQANVVLWVQ